MKALKMIGAVVFTLALIIPAHAQKGDKYERTGKVVTVTKYYEDGSVKEKGTFVKGVPHGKWVEYTPTGKVKTEAQYKNGLKDGTWFVWSEDGEFLFEVIYQDNVLQNASRWKIAERNAIANN